MLFLIPEGFDPKRFLKEKERPTFSYIPFGGGPRACIGNNFAMMEGITALAKIVQKYRLELEKYPKAEKEALITLRPKNGLWMRLNEW